MRRDYPRPPSLSSGEGHRPSIVAVAGLVLGQRLDLDLGNRRVHPRLDGEFVAGPFWHFQAVLGLRIAKRIPERADDVAELGPAADNQAAIFVARSFIFKKQGKAAESRAALAKARTFERLIKELQ